MQFARSRANKMKSVTAHMQASSGDRHSDQGEVWDDVQQRARKLGVDSPTIAMSDIFLKHAETLKSYVCSVTAVDCQVGAVFAINGAIRGFELLDCSSTFSKLFPKVLHSYALDAIDLLDEWNGEPPGVIQDAVRHFIDGAGTATASVFAATGAGNEVRISGSGLAGSALVVDGRVTHVAAFPNSVIPDKAI